MRRSRLKMFGLLLMSGILVGNSFWPPLPRARADEELPVNLARDYEVIINYCRLLMDRYPDTQQVENALAILSQVPDEYLGEYRITHEGRTYSSYDSNK